MNLREKILNASDIRSEIVRVDAWDVSVEVRGLSGEQRAQVVNAARREDGSIDDGRIIVPLIIAATFDPDTKAQVFQKADRDTLETKNAAVLDEVAKVALRLSGLGDASSETLRGNSNGTPSADSTSG
jgi:hypothetical protein